MFDGQSTLRPASFDDAAETGVGAVLARWVVEDPCPLAVAELSAIDPASLEAADRVRLLVAWERQSAWIASMQLPVLVAVGDAYAETVSDARDLATGRLASAEGLDSGLGADDPRPGGRRVSATVSAIFGDDPDRWATAEIATALHVAEFTASTRLGLARTLPRRLPLLNAALRVGLVSYGHVLLVARETEPLNDDLARSVDARLARRYGQATPGQLRNVARHLVIAADPAGAKARHEAAALRRSLRTRPEHDGMASLGLLAPATDVSLIEAALSDIADRTAAAAAAAGRLIADRDTLLADALVALARYWLHDTWPIPEPDPREQHDEPARPPSRPNSPSIDDRPIDDPPVPRGKRGRRRRGRDHTVVNIVIDLPTLLGLAQHPARLDGYGPIPAALARRLAVDGSWRRMVTDPITRRLLDRAPTTYRPGHQLAAYVRARDLVCDHPGCTRPADGCQLDHDDPFDLADPDGGRTVADDLHPLCEAHHNAKTHLGWQTGTRSDGTRYTRSPLGFDYDLDPSPYLDHA